MNYADENLASDPTRAHIGPATDFDIIRFTLDNLRKENDCLQKVIERLRVKADAFDALIFFQRSTNYHVGVDTYSSSAEYGVFAATEALERIERTPGENLKDLDASDLVPEAPEQSAAIPTDEEILLRLKRIADHIGIPSEGKLPSKGTASAY